MRTEVVNKWWQRANEKHAQREAVQPKKASRFAVVTRDTSFEPQSGRTRERHQI